MEAFPTISVAVWSWVLLHYVCLGHPRHEIQVEYLRVFWVVGLLLFMFFVFEFIIFSGLGLQVYCVGAKH